MGNKGSAEMPTTHSLDYCYENIIFNEQLFAIKGDQLKQLLHRSIGALTFLDKYMKIHAGSATLISKDTLLTAAHNVYNQQYKSLNEQFRFYIGADGIGEKYYEIESWRFPKEFETCSLNQKLKHDYAIFMLKEPIIFEEYLPLAQACAECLSENRLKTTLKVFGFPAAYGNFKGLDKQANKIHLCQYGLSRLGRIAEINGQQGKLGYGISTLAGQSGCPVVADDRIIAIHVGGYQGKYNIGRIIDKNLIEKIRQWGKQLGTEQYLIKQEKICTHQRLVLRSQKMLKMKTINSAKKEIRNEPAFNQDEKSQEIKVKNPLIYQDAPTASIQQKSKPVITNPNNIKGGDERPKNQNLEKQINPPPNIKANPGIKLVQKSQNLLNLDLREYGNLLELNLWNNKLRQINLAHCPHLTKLNLGSNQLQRIDLTNNKHLTWIDLSNNHLKEVDVRANLNLTDLWLAYNQLQKVDVKDNVNLTLLDLFFNSMAEIDITNNTKLEQLGLSKNNLVSVKLCIAYNVQQNRFTDYFDLSNQQSAACRVQLTCQAQTKQKAGRIAEHWNERYNKSFYNMYKCVYSFEVV